MPQILPHTTQYPKTPNMTIMMEITVESIGLSINVFNMIYFLILLKKGFYWLCNTVKCNFLGLDRRTVPQLVDSAHYNQIPSFQT